MDRESEKAASAAVCGGDASDCSEVKRNEEAASDQNKPLSSGLRSQKDADRSSRG